MQCSPKPLLAKIFLSAIFIVAGLNCASAETDAEAPYQPCTSEGQVFHYVQSYRSPWSLNELYAVPSGITSPLQWNQYLDFATQFQTQVDALEIDDPVLLYSESCKAIWTNFFSTDCDILLSLRRNISFTHQSLLCTLGTWLPQDFSSESTTDISDWIRLGNAPFDVNDSTSHVAMRLAIQNLLETLNNQPGAATPSE